jgi:Zn-dependent peptidase ImmA (M78 family)/transcriptional regulator with XRE-family HTH domain
MSEFNPQVFVWAREAAGLTVDDAAAALHVKPSSLQEIEAGRVEPSRPQLLHMAQVYRRSLLTFYLPTPPAKGDRGQDFRTVVTERVRSAEASIDALVRDVRSRQGVVRSTLQDEDDFAPPAFVGSFDMGVGVTAVRDSIVSTIGFDLAEFRKQASNELAFNTLRAKVEAVGVFVMLIGNLGSHHSAIPVEAFRGIALADPVAPFIVVNDQDARAAWSFTLLHELAHLWLGASGVSDGPSEQRIELFCNEVAAEILAPRAELAGITLDELNEGEQIDAIQQLARQWRVSRPMVAYRLFKAERISRDAWRSLDAKFREMFAEERQREKTAARAKKGAPSYYVVRRHKLGPAMLGFAMRSLNAGTLSPVKAAQVLGVSPRSVFTLLSSPA